MARPLLARVHDGHLILDEPVSLPEGTEVRLEMPDESDPRDPRDRSALDAALRRARSEFESRETMTMRQMLARLQPSKPTKHYDVQLAAEALRHAVQIRLSFAISPVGRASLFVQELEAGLGVLANAPHIGASLGRGVPELKCLRMPRSGTRLYYDVLERKALVRVYAIWHRALSKAAAPRRRPSRPEAQRVSRQPAERAGAGRSLASGALSGRRRAARSRAGGRRRRSPRPRRRAAPTRRSAPRSSGRIHHLAALARRTIDAAVRTSAAQHAMPDLTASRPRSTPGFAAPASSASTTRCTWCGPTRSSAPPRARHCNWRTHGSAGARRYAVCETAK